MKKKRWIFLASILLVVTVLCVCHNLLLPNYEAPFKAEEVKSVRLTKNWEYRIIEDRDEIDNLVSSLNKIKIVSDFRESPVNQIPLGGDGYSLHIELADGRQLDYIAATTTNCGMKFTNEKGNAYKVRNFWIGSIWNPKVEPDCPPIPANFITIYYQGKVYEDTATITRVPKDAEYIGTVTGITYIPDCELESSYGKTGDNVYVWERNGITKLGIEIEQDVWPDPQAAVIEIACRNEAIPNDWGVALSADNVTSKGLTIVCYQSGGENVAQLHTGTYYVLQKLESEMWVDVEYLPQEYDVGWTMEALVIEKESATFWKINWEWLYGELPAGEYRIGKVITNFRATGDYDEEMFYAEFVIA